MYSSKLSNSNDENKMQHGANDEALCVCVLL